MFSRLVAIFLIVTVISSNFAKFLVFASFELNQKYIAEKLCENRNRPQMHCNGKCYLMKKLKQAEEKDQKQEMQGLKNFLLFQALTGKTEHIQFNASLLGVLSVPEHPIYHFTELTFIFHPPRA